MNEYVHPDSGRVYREGDPAHYFAALARALSHQAGEFIRHYDAKMAGKDYLAQSGVWESDPNRIAQAMADTITKLGMAYRALQADKHAPGWGLGKYDDEWRRKYGDLPDTPHQ